MTKKQLTQEEYEAIWEQIDALWKSTGPHLKGGWIEARFKLNLFKSTLEGQGAKRPFGM